MMASHGSRGWVCLSRSCPATTRLRYQGGQLFASELAWKEWKRIVKCIQILRTERFPRFSSAKRTDALSICCPLSHEPMTDA